ERLTLLLEAMAREDEPEVERLQTTCPRVTYTGQDLQFEDRLSLHFANLAGVTIDLRCMWGKLHVLHWLMGNTGQIAVRHHLTAALAFVDGIRCGQGLKQCEFFAKPLPPPEAEVVEADEDEADDEDEAGVEAEEEEGNEGDDEGVD